MIFAACLFTMLTRSEAFIPLLLVLRHPTLLSLDVTGAKPLSFKSRPRRIFMAPRKPNKFQNGTDRGPKWTLGSHWGEQETYFEGLNKQNAKCSKETTAKI